MTDTILLVLNAIQLMAIAMSTTIIFLLIMWWLLNKENDK